MRPALAAVVVVLASAGSAAAAVASWYGPGLYGNRLGCGGVLTPRTWGVANKTLRCGTRVTLCYRRRCVTAPVVDRGPYVYGRDFDLTAPVARALCRCSQWGVRDVTIR